MDNLSVPSESDNAPRRSSTESFVKRDSTFVYDHITRRVSSFLDETEAKEQLELTDPCDLEKPDLLRNDATLSTVTYAKALENVKVVGLHAH